MDAEAKQLADQSDKFHAFEWLRRLALEGNKHAITILQPDGVLDACREEGRNEVIFGPCPELNGTVPLVLYFKTNADRDGFVELVQQAKPNFKMRNL